jgi:hypothetical protein
VPAECGVFGEIHDPHAAFAELVGNPIMRDGFANHVSGVTQRDRQEREKQTKALRA